MVKNLSFNAFKKKSFLNKILKHPHTLFNENFVLITIVVVAPPDEADWLPHRPDLHPQHCVRHPGLVVSLHPRGVGAGQDRDGHDHPPHPHCHVQRSQTERAQGLLHLLP